jgi:5-methylcytosine-specific restriction protein B
MATKTTKVDVVRDYLLSTVIDTARKSNQSQVTIVSGPVAKAVGMTDRMPLVCSAIGAQVFQTKNGLRLLNRVGPQAGATVAWTFAV